MTGWLAVPLAAAVVVAGLLARARFYPYGPCPACHDRDRGGKGRGLGSSVGAYSRCRRCGGKGERIRRISRIYPKWRAQAREQRRK